MAKSAKTSLPDWDPMRDAYNDPSFNSYKDGPGAHLDASILNSRSGTKKKSGPFKLYVASIPAYLNKDGLTNLFLNYGEPFGVFRNESQVENTKTWGFVQYNTFAEADRAIRELNGKPPMKLKVEFARESENTPKVPQTKDIEVHRGESFSHQTAPVSVGESRIGHTRSLMQSNASNKEYVPEEEDDPRYFQPYRGSRYDLVNHNIMSQPRVAMGNWGPMKVSMGRGSFDRSEEMNIRQRTACETGDVDLKDVLSLLEIKCSNKVSERNFGSKDKYKHMTGICTLCHNEALSRCQQCNAWYCSVKCQEADWAKHKKICMPGLSSTHPKGSEDQNKCVRNSTGNTSVPGGISEDIDVYAGGDTVLVNQARGKSSGQAAVNKEDHKKFEKKQNENFIESPKRQLENEHKHWNQEKGKESKQPFKKTENEYKSDKKGNYQKKPFNQEKGSKDGKPYFKKAGTENGYKGAYEKKGYDKGGTKKTERVSQGKEKDLNNSVEEVPSVKNLEGKTTVELCPMDMVDELPRDGFHQVIVAYHIGGFDYYVQLAEKIPQVYSASFNLKACANDDTVLTPKIGLHCAAEFEGNWFRARVTSINPLKVVYVDYGNEEQCNLSQLKRLPDSEKNFKAMGIKIRLAPGTPPAYQDVAMECDMLVKFTKKDSDGASLVHLKGVEYSVDSVEEAAPLLNIIDVLEPDEKVHLMVFDLDECIGALLSSKMEQSYMKIGVTGTEFQSMCNNLPEDASYNPSVGDIVVARIEGAWGRAFVLGKMEGMTYLAFCDTGLLMLTSEFKKVPDIWTKIPYFMVHYNSTGLITGERKDTYIFTGVVEDVSRDTAHIALECTSKKVCKAVVKPWQPPYELCNNLECCELRDGPCQLTAYLSARVLYVRPLYKECNDLFREVTQSVAKYCHTAPSLQRAPKEGEVLAALFSQDKLYYRARVRRILDKKALVTFIDYGNEEEVQFTNLKLLPEELRKKLCTVVKVVLDNVSDVALNEKVREYLDALCIKEIQMTLKRSAANSNKVTLSDSSGNDVNEHLNKLLSPSWKAPSGNKEDRFYFSKFPYDKLLIGNTYKVVVTWALTHNSIICIPRDSKIVESLDHLNKDIKKYCDENSESYVPVEEELCLVRKDDLWLRAALLSHSSAGLRVILIDFGELIEVQHTDIRKIPKEFCVLPGASVQCNVIYKRETTGLEEKLKERLRDLETTEIKILDEQDFSYDIQIVQENSLF